MGLIKFGVSLFLTLGILYLAFIGMKSLIIGGENLVKNSPSNLVNNITNAIKFSPSNTCAINTTNSSGQNNSCK